MARIHYRLEDLRALTALQQTASFVRAADLLHITQSAFSRRISQLEESLGGALVERSTRQVALSTLGLELVRRATPHLDGLDVAVGEASKIARGESGRIAIACLATAVQPLLSAAFVEFRAEYPKVRLQLHDDMAQPVRNSVLERKAEFGIGVVDGCTGGLHFDHIVDDPFVTAFKKGHPLAQRAEVEWVELMQWRCVCARTAQMEAISTALVEAGIDPPWFDEVQHSASMLGLLNDGTSVGISTLLASACATEGFESRPLVRPLLTRQIGLFKRVDANLSHPALALWTILGHKLKNFAAQSIGTSSAWMPIDGHLTMQGEE
jgi:DNA-binding transcriptional LysR family regulator